MNDSIDPRLIKTIRVNQLAPTLQNIEASMFTKYSFIQREGQSQRGISRLLSSDLFRALLLLTIINAAAFIYLTLFIEDRTLTQSQSISMLEDFYPTTSPEASVLSDIANLHGTFKNKESIQLDAIRHKLLSFISPEQELIVGGSTPLLQFEKKNGGLIWLGKP
jgi:hypothetical protein